LRVILGDFKTELNKKLQSWSKITASDKWIYKFPYECKEVLHFKWNYHVAWFYVRMKPFQQNIQRAKLCPLPKTCSETNSALHRCERSPASNCSSAVGKVACRSPFGRRLVGPTTSMDVVTRNRKIYRCHDKHQ